MANGGPQFGGLTPDQRVRRLGPFLLVILATFPLTLIGHQPGQSWTLVGASAASFAVVGVLVTVVPWSRFPAASPWAIVAMFCMGVGILRHSGGGAMGGYGGLLILPIVWLAAYGRRRDVTIAIVFTTLTLTVPVLLWGPPLYPSSEWRRVAISALTFWLTGVVVGNLVSRVTRQQQMLEIVVDLEQNFGDDIPAATCDAVRRASGAAAVMYWEIDGMKRARPVASTEPDTPLTPVPSEEMAPGLRHAVVTGRAWFSSGSPHDRDEWPTSGAHEPRTRAVLHQPVLGPDGSVTALISVSWLGQMRRLAVDVGQVVRALARDAARETERLRLLRRLDRMAHADQLTGMLNRRAWDERLAVSLNHAARFGEGLAVAMLDMDRFKAYNDRMGHIAGDQLLIDATSAWSAELRAVDVLARWGGEEFVVLLPGSDVDGARIVLDRLRKVTPQGETFSAGLAVMHPGERCSAQELLAAADTALYEAKANGRNRIVAAD